MSLLGTIDRPGRLPPQGAVSARHPAVGEDADRARGRAAGHAARRACALGWPGSPEDLFVDADGSPVRIDKALLVGVPAVGARADAQRDHQRLARRSVPRSTR